MGPADRHTCGVKLDEIRRLADTTGLVVYGRVVPHALTRKAWRHAHTTGQLVTVHHGVSRLIDAADSVEMRIAAAIAAARPAQGLDRVFAGGRTAAYLLGIDVPADRPIHLVARGRPSPAGLAGVQIHRPRNHIDLVAHDPTAAIPCVRPVRALLDVAAWDPHLTSGVLEQMIVQRLITIRDAEAAIVRHSKQGRPGLKVLRETVEAWGLRQRPPDSVLEARFARLRREFGLPEFEFQRPVGRYRPDFSRLPERVIVECAGFRDHGRRQAQIERDNERAAELAADGWVLLQFSWHQINHRSAWVASRIHRTLLQRRAQFGLVA